MERNNLVFRLCIMQVRAYSPATFRLIRCLLPTTFTGRRCKYLRVPERLKGYVIPNRSQAQL